MQGALGCSEPAGQHLGVMGQNRSMQIISTLRGGLAVAAVLLSTTLATAQTGSSGSSGSAPDYDPSGAPGRQTLSDLKRHYGIRLKASNSYCSLPKGTITGKEAGWDCTLWYVDKDSRARFLMIPVDSVQYRTLPDGSVVREAYSIEGRCERVLSVFFSIAQFLYAGQPMEQSGFGGGVRAEDVMGELRVTRRQKLSGGDAVSLMTMNFRDQRCELRHSVEMSG